MQISAGLRTSAMLAGLYLGASIDRAIDAQVATSNLHPGTISATISVATLKTPIKAREHFEKARNAALLHREDVYEREIRKALEIAPNFADAYLLIAEQENSAGRYKEAIGDATRARALDPAGAWGSILMASAYNGEARYDEALLVLSNLHGSGAEAWQADYEMGRAEIGRGDAERALHWSLLALNRAPGTWVDAHLLLANALQLAHRWKEASGQMEVYLASRMPLKHRAEVEVALAHTRRLAEQQDEAPLAAPAEHSSPQH